MEDKIKEFLNEYKELCKKYGMCLSHEDNQGGFIVDEYNDDNIDWVMSAMNGWEIRKRKMDEINELVKRSQ